MSGAITMPPAAAWTDVAALTDIPRRGAIRIASARGTIAVFRTGADACFALLDRCPHKAGPLSYGIVHEARVTCPLHGMVIDLASGHAVAPDEGCAPVIPLRLEAGRVLLAIAGHGEP